MKSNKNQNCIVMILEALADKCSVSLKDAEVNDNTLRVCESVLQEIVDADDEDIPAYELDICW